MRPVAGAAHRRVERGRCRHSPIDAAIHFEQVRAAEVEPAVAGWLFDGCPVPARRMVASTCTVAISGEPLLAGARQVAQEWRYHRSRFGQERTFIFQLGGPLLL